MEKLLYKKYKIASSDSYRIDEAVLKFWPSWLQMQKIFKNKKVCLMNELPMYKFFYEMFMHLSFFLTVAKGLPDSMQLQQNKR